MTRLIVAFLNFANGHKTASLPLQADLRTNKSCLIKSQPAFSHGTTVLLLLLLLLYYYYYYYYYYHHHHHHHYHHHHYHHHHHHYHHD